MSELYPELTFSELSDLVKKFGLPVRLLRDLDGANFASTLSGCSADQKKVSGELHRYLKEIIPELYRRPDGTMSGGE